MSSHDASSEEVDVFAQKLQDFAQRLSPTEQNLLATLVTRAAHPADDVEGHFIGLEPIIVDPGLHLAQAYSLVAWLDILPHLHSFVHHAISGTYVSPHLLPHLPISHK